MLSTSRRWFVFPVALAALLVTLSAPVASAQWAQRRPDWNDRNGAAGYDNGYRQGVSQGERDARDRRSYDYDRHSAYRSVRGDSQYRDTFRQGFAQGYRDGYYRYASNGRNGGWGNGGYGNVSVAMTTDVGGTPAATAIRAWRMTTASATDIAKGWTPCATAIASTRFARRGIATPIPATTSATDRSRRTRTAIDRDIGKATSGPIATRAAEAAGPISAGPGNVSQVVAETS